MIEVIYGKTLMLLSLVRQRWEMFASCKELDKEGNVCERVRWHELPHVSKNRIWSKSGK